MTELYVTEALDRVPADAAGPGEIVALAGLPDVTIGETIADPDDPQAAARDDGRRAEPVGDDRHQHEPARRHGGHPADREPGEGAARRRARRQRLAPGAPTARPDAWEVQGRGELQLAILVELMRREGFELTVGKPEVLTKEVDGKRLEPVERVAIDIPEEFVGVVTQLLALRKGRLQQMVNHGSGWARMEYLVPARGLIGFRTEFLTETRGTGILHHVFEAWEPWHGELRTRPTGSLVADRRGQATGFAIAQPAGARLALRLAGRRALRGNGRRRELARQRPRRERLEAEEADEHARRICRRARPADPAAAALARAGARVHPRRRGGRGHAEVDPARKVELSATGRQKLTRRARA